MTNKPFSQFPLRLADQWEGRELGLDEKVLKKLEFERLHDAGLCFCRQSGWRGNRVQGI